MGWSLGVEPWSGVLEWNIGVEYWSGPLEWLLGDIYSDFEFFVATSFSLYI